MLVGIKNVLIISTLGDTPKFVELLEDSSQFEVSLSYKVKFPQMDLFKCLSLVMSFLTMTPELCKVKRLVNSRLDRNKLVEDGFMPFTIWQDTVERYLKEGRL